jgi:hypothetical protein
MEHIIQQIATGFVKEIMGYYEKEGLHGIGAMADDILVIAKGTARELLATLIAYTDAEFVALKEERRSEGISVHERHVPRTLFTALGDFTYERTYFDIPEGRAYLLDGLLEVDAYERVDTHVSARMANESALSSFARSAAKESRGSLSRQTAWRKAMESGEVAYLPERLPSPSERLHIFADEDHVHLQDGKGAMLPLVTVCTGKRQVCIGRNELTDRMHMNGYGLSPERFWEYVYAACDHRYGMEGVKEVFIYGDGAKWIAAAENCFPCAVRVMDAHHYRQKMKTLTAGEICSGFSPALYSAVRHGKKAEFGGTVSEIMRAVGAMLPQGRERERKLKVIADAAGYLLDRWEAVMNMKREGSIGSCTEAMVSHVFSERFSRNPMGWSKAGLAKMSQLRVLVENGGKLMPSDMGACKRTKGEKRTVPKFIERYEALVRRQQEEAFLRSKDWRVFEHEHVEWAAPSGTKVALDALARIRSIA